MAGAVVIDPPGNRTIMEIKTLQTHHLVKSEDLNHHGTLYAGRMADWIVEAGFMAAAALTNPVNIVCLKIHGLLFTRPVRKGEIVELKSRVVHAGKSTLIANVQARVGEAPAVAGFLTFIHVDEDAKSKPHGIVLEPRTDEEIELQQQALALPR